MPPLKTSLLLLIGFGIFLIIHYFSLKPYSIQTYYHRDFLGFIYYNSTGACFDICFFYTYSPLLQAQSRTFSVLFVPSPYRFIKDSVESNYAKDALTVFYRNTVLVNADPGSFTALSIGMGHDKNSYYIRDQKLNDYLTSNIPRMVPLTLKQPIITSYIPEEYFVIKDADKYYFVKINPHPPELKDISEEEARLLPELLHP